MSETVHDPSKRRLFKNAAALGAAAAAGAVGARFAGRCADNGGTLPENTMFSAQHSQQSYNCHGIHQAGIATPHQPFGIVSAFDVSVGSAAELQEMLKLLSRRIEFLTQGGELHDDDAKLPPEGSGILGKTVPPDGLTVTVALGSSLFDGRFGLAAKKPKRLQEMRDFPNDKLQEEWCDGDFSVQFCAFSPEVCQNALRDIIKNLSKYAVIRWSLEGFLPKAPPGEAARNLLGFRDGTANPDVSQTKIADEVLWTGVAANALDEPEWAKNGSYQAVRIIRHFVEFWDRTPLQEQQTIFGRDKYSGAPIGMKQERDEPDYASAGNEVPADSHIRLANPRTAEFMKKHLLYRRPYDYSRGLAKSGQLDVGLLFICYQANLEDGFIFVQNLLNGEPLEEYISPFGGGYYFALPGFEKDGYLGQGLFA